MLRNHAIGACVSVSFKLLVLTIRLIQWSVTLIRCSQGRLDPVNVVDPREVHLKTFRVFLDLEVVPAAQLTEAGVPLVLCSPIFFVEILNFFKLS